LTKRSRAAGCAVFNYPFLTSKERDIETGLDYFLARYYSSTQGRFTSPDEPLIGQDEPDPQTWNLYSYTSNNPLNRTDEEGQRWFYKCVDGNCDVQWVNPNKDGTYTSPGEGYKEFIPTKEQPNLIIYSSDGYQVYRFGENADGSPKAKWLWTGKVENKPDHVLAAAFAFQEILNLARASFTAWQAARTAATQEIKAVGTQAGTNAIQQQVVNTTAGKITGFTKHGINQAISRDGVGVATRAIADAVKNPIKVVAGRNGATKYIGRDATVVLNKAGKVITTWARNSAGRRL
jgi:RHS repeat-associated protein